MLIAVVVSLELLCQATAFAKFGKPPSYHSYLAKLWGLVLAPALVAAFVAKHPAGWLVAALVLGGLSTLEGTAMSLILPAWRTDVPTLVAAWRLRRTTLRRIPTSAAKVPGVLVLAIAMSSITAHAQQAGQAVYETGTGAVRPDATAAMIAGQSSLQFATPTPLVVPYDTIDSATWRKDVREHLGFFPAMLVGMVAARVHVYRLTLSYHGNDGARQVAVFRLSRKDAISLSELLSARLPCCKEKGACRPLYEK